MPTNSRASSNDSMCGTIGPVGCSGPVTTFPDRMPPMAYTTADAIPSRSAISSTTW